MGIVGAFDDLWSGCDDVIGDDVDVVDVVIGWCHGKSLFRRNASDIERMREFCLHAHDERT